MFFFFNKLCFFLIDLPTGPSKMFSSSSSSSSNRHYSIPRDPRRSLLRPEDGKSDSQSLSRDPRKRRKWMTIQSYPKKNYRFFVCFDTAPIKHEKDLEGPETEVDDGELIFIFYFYFVLVHSCVVYMWCKKKGFMVFRKRLKMEHWDLFLFFKGGRLAHVVILYE